MTYNDFITGKFVRVLNVPGFEERYTIDNKGNVYSFSSNKHISPGNNGVVSLCKNGMKKNFHTLTLLAMAFPDVELPDDTYIKYDKWFGKKRGVYPWNGKKHPWRAVISAGHANQGKVSLGYYATKDEAYKAFAVMYTMLRNRRPW